MKRIILTAILLTACAVCLEAQNISLFTRDLSLPDSMSGARVKIVEHGSAVSAVTEADMVAQERIKGYRVCIFSDRSQNARSTARDVEANFKSLFPDIPAYMSYENPYFRVLVGNCSSEEEVQILMGKIKGTFNKAFMVDMDIPIEDFL